MGTQCCNLVKEDGGHTELSLNPSTSGTNINESIVSELIPKLKQSKTMSKKEAKKFKIPRSITDSLSITQSQFVFENRGMLSESYEFEKQLGQGTRAITFIGSYGTVYKAVHKGTHEKRAIKLINKANVPKEKEGELFSEIKVLKEMDNPVIMKIFEFASDKNYYYLVSE